MTEPRIQPLSENLWIIDYAFRMAGCSLGRRSTLIRLCDLLFNIHPSVNLWTRCFMHWVNGAFGRPAISRFYRCWIKDREAFAGTMESVLREWDFDRIIVGHGVVIENDGKQVLKQALERAGY